MKEAYLYEKQENNKVHCRLCCHRCLIAEGSCGICGVRENREGTLYSLVYGRAIAANVDPIEKKPLYHFLPGSKSYSIATIGCNFRCEFCQNWQISQYSKNVVAGLPDLVPTGARSRLSRSEAGESGTGVPAKEDHIPGEDLPPKKVVELALEAGCQSIAYTYTEPTIFFEYAFDTAIIARKKGLKNIFVTSGYQTPETIEKMTGLIDAANIDLKSFSDDYYRGVCGARLQPVLDSIKLMHEKGIWVEVTTLVVPEQNDSEEELKQIADFLARISLDIPWHISRFHPNYQMNGAYPTPVETLYQAAEIGRSAGLRYVYVGNLFSSKHQSTCCPKCGEVTVERLGYQVESKLAKGECLKCGERIAGRWV